MLHSVAMEDLLDLNIQSFDFKTIAHADASCDNKMRQDSLLPSLSQGLLTPPASSPDSFVCEACGDAFQESFALEYHTQTHHNIVTKQLLEGDLSSQNYNLNLNPTSRTNVSSRPSIESKPEVFVSTPSNQTTRSQQHKNQHSGNFQSVQASNPISSKNASEIKNTSFTSVSTSSSTDANQKCDIILQEVSPIFSSPNVATSQTSCKNEFYPPNITMRAPMKNTINNSSQLQAMNAHFDLPRFVGPDSGPVAKKCQFCITWFFNDEFEDHQRKCAKHPAQIGANENPNLQIVPSVINDRANLMRQMNIKNHRPNGCVQINDGTRLKPGILHSPYQDSSQFPGVIYNAPQRANLNTYWTNHSEMDQRLATLLFDKNAVRQYSSYNHIGCNNPLPTCSSQRYPNPMAALYGSSRYLPISNKSCACEACKGRFIDSTGYRFSSQPSRMPFEVTQSPTNSMYHHFQNNPTLLCKPERSTQVQPYSSGTHVPSNSMQQYGSSQYFQRKPSSSPPFVSSGAESFSRKATKSQHVHSTAKPYERYKCPFCPKYYTEEKSLTNHMRWHTGTYAFQCPICQSTFSEINFAVLHLQAHTKDYTTVCPCCTALEIQDHNEVINHLESHLIVRNLTAMQS